MLAALVCLHLVELNLLQGEIHLQLKGQKVTYMRVKYVCTYAHTFIYICVYWYILNTPTYKPMHLHPYISYTQHLHNYKPTTLHLQPYPSTITFTHNHTLQLYFTIPTSIHATTHYRPHTNAAMKMCNAIACACKNDEPPVEGRGEKKKMKKLYVAKTKNMYAHTHTHTHTRTRTHTQIQA